MHTRTGESETYKLRKLEKTQQSECGEMCINQIRKGVSTMLKKGVTHAQIVRVEQEQ